MTFVHASAQVEDGASLGDACQVWANSQIRSGASVGGHCIIGRNVFVDVDVRIGDNVKIQNNASLFQGVTVEDGAFIGPHVVFTNDRVPRSVNPDGSLKSKSDWSIGRTTVCRGAAIGAGAVIVTGVTIGTWAMVGSGSVVTHDVGPHVLVVGNPARAIGFVSAAGLKCDSLDAARDLTLHEALTRTQANPVPELKS